MTCEKYVKFLFSASVLKLYRYTVTHIHSRVVYGCFQALTRDHVARRAKNVYSLALSRHRILLPVMTETQVVVAFHVVSSNLWLLIRVAEAVRWE